MTAKPKQYKFLSLPIPKLILMKTAYESLIFLAMPEGRGRLADGERRVNGKPRDPPGVMPPRETNRDPGTKPQLPEGWNKPRDDWKNGIHLPVLHPNAKSSSY